MQMIDSGSQQDETSEADEDFSDESCDFFSDNLSETATGVLPENSGRSIRKAVNQQNYHLFVFVHGFQASSHDMRAFRNHL